MNQIRSDKTTSATKTPSPATVKSMDYRLSIFPLIPTKIHKNIIIATGVSGQTGSFRISNTNRLLRRQLSKLALRRKTTQRPDPDRG